MSKSETLKKIETIIGKLVHLSASLPHGCGNTDTQEAARSMAHLRDCIQNGSITFSRNKKKA